MVDVVPRMVDSDGGLESPDEIEQIDEQEHQGITTFAFRWLLMSHCLACASFLCALPFQFGLMVIAIVFYVVVVHVIASLITYLQDRRCILKTEQI